MPKADRARSHLKICCHGRVVASSTSSVEMPRALASMRARSWAETINWSRSLEDRSFISTRHTRKTTSEVTPEPMAEARPTWGLKSRTMAGVATRMAPSTSPRAQMTMAKPHLPEASGTPTATSRPMMSRP